MLILLKGDEQMFTKRIKFLTLFVILIFAISCKGKEDIPQAKETLVIEHELGRTEIASTPKRVVVFDYGVLDILNYIDVEPIGLVKRNFPDRLAKFGADKYENIGTLFEPNFEKLFEIRPDIIFISGRQRNLYNDLSEIAPVVYLGVDGPTYFSDLETNAKILGKIFNKEEKINEKLKEISKEVESLKEKTSNKTALFLMLNGGNLAVYGLDSRFDYLYTSFGFKAIDENIEIVNHGNRISYEYLYEKNPDYLFVMDRAVVVEGSENNFQNLLNNEIIKSLKAYENNNIASLETFAWYISAGGFDSTSLMIEEVKSVFE